MLVQRNATVKAGAVTQLVVKGVADEETNHAQEQPSSGLRECKAVKDNFSTC